MCSKFKSSIALIVEWEASKPNTCLLLILLHLRHFHRFTAPHGAGITMFARFCIYHWRQWHQRRQPARCPPPWYYKYKKQVDRSSINGGNIEGKLGGGGMKDASLPDAVHQEARHQITSMETGLLLQLKKLVKNSAPHTCIQYVPYN